MVVNPLLQEFGNLWPDSLVSITNRQVFLGRGISSEVRRGGVCGGEQVDENWRIELGNARCRRKAPGLQVYQLYATVF